jgi:hypothetical protein
VLASGIRLIPDNYRIPILLNLKGLNGSESSVLSDTGDGYVMVILGYITGNCGNLGCEQMLISVPMICPPGGHACVGQRED